MYTDIARSFNDVKVYSDNYGSPEFMNSFKIYINKEGKNNLFQNWEFDFLQSKDALFIQVADFISGSLARIYDVKKGEGKGAELKYLLLDKCLRVDEWPRIFLNIPIPPSDKLLNEDNNEIIVNLALNNARRFLQINEDSFDPDLRLQVETLQFLLLNYNFIDPHKFVSTQELIDHLNKIGIGVDLSVQKLRSGIIAKLRDAGNIIASSPSGYKIPSDINDIYSFVERANSVVLPMLNRVEDVRKQYLFASKNSIDILKPERFRKLADLIGKNIIKDIIES